MFCADKTASQGASQHFLTGTIAAFLVLFGAMQAEAQIKPVQLHQNKTIILPFNTKLNQLPFGFEVMTVGASKIQGKLSSSGVNWVCKGSVCSTSVKYPGFGVAACNKLALAIGPVRSFRLTRQPPAQKSVKGYPFNAKQIARCNQGVNGLKSATMNTRLAVPAARYSSIQNTGVAVGNSSVSQAANRVKKIGEASNRMKQARELQRLQELGSVVDQAMGGGAAGRQDCSRSANRAKCLRDNMKAGNTPAPSTGGGMSDCLLAGGNLPSCFNGGRNSRGSGAGRISNGPGGAADGANIPGRGQAEAGGSKGDGHNWGQWRGVDTGVPGQNSMRRTSQNDDGSISDETVTTDSNTGNTTRDIATYVEGEAGGASQTTRSNADGRVVFTVDERSQADGTSTMVVKEYGEDGSISTSTTVTHPGTGEQSAPDGSSGETPDNCNWNPGLGKCMTQTPDSKGMTSRPGPDGENTGGILGRNAPKIDIGAAINCGDASSEACKQVGSGLNNGAKRLDMKDTGEGGPAGGSPK